MISPWQQTWRVLFENDRNGLVAWSLSSLKSSAYWWPWPDENFQQKKAIYIGITVFHRGSTCFCNMLKNRLPNLIFCLLSSKGNCSSISSSKIVFARILSFDCCRDFMQKCKENIVLKIKRWFLSFFCSTVNKQFDFVSQHNDIPILNKPNVWNEAWCENEMHQQLRFYRFHNDVLI